GPEPMKGRPASRVTATAGPPTGFACRAFCFSRSHDAQPTPLPTNRDLSSRKVSEWTSPGRESPLAGTTAVPSRAMEPVGKSALSGGAALAHEDVATTTQRPANRRLAVPPPVVGRVLDA